MRIVSIFKSILFLLIFEFGYQLLPAQNLVIDSIIISGLTRTNKEIVLRDINIRPGDSLIEKKIPEVLIDNRLNLMNTGIYSQVKIGFERSVSKKDAVNILIHVDESWHIYLVPYLELVDRNFNVWIRDFNLDFSRINAGIKMFISNLTGNRDRLDGVAHFGYHDKIEASYWLPYVNKKQNLGIQFSGLWAKSKELAYATTESNVQKRWLSDTTLIFRKKFTAALIYQPRLRTRQRIKIEWRQIEIDKRVLDRLQPDYLGSPSGKLDYPVISYNITYDNRNIRPHPTKGFMIDFFIEKQGINNSRDALITKVDFKYFKRLSSNWTATQQIKNQNNWSNTPTDYYHNRALGDEIDYLRGYEYYIIDGQQYTFSKTSFQYLFYDKEWSLGNIMPIKSLRTPQVQFFFAFNFDMGYIPTAKNFNKTNFNDKLLKGGGVGLEIVAFYDKMLQIEYSMNEKYEKDIFLHLNLNF